MSLRTPKPPQYIKPRKVPKVHGLVLPSLFESVTYTQNTTLTNKFISNENTHFTSDVGTI